jgi:lantibiotic biosynthesis protein
MELFKHGMLRICGDTFENLNDLNIDFLPKIEQLALAQHNHTEQKDLLVDQIFDYIKNAPDPVQQKKMLNIKRSVFNNRFIKEKELDFFLGQIEPALLQALQQWNGRLAGLDQQLQALENDYAAASKAISLRFLQLAQTELFKKGLILGSHDLLNRLLHYAKHPNDVFSGKYYHIEQGLMKYYSRMVAKTSPFSTFTNLSPVGYQEAPSSNQVFLHDMADKPLQSRVRLNNYLLMFLKNLLTKYVPFSQNLRINVNPSLRLLGEEYVFLINENNTESFQRIAQSDIIEFIIETIQENGQMTYREIVGVLTEAVEAAPEEIEAYLNKLLQYGLIEYTFPISGNDPNWIPKLFALLKANPTPTTALGKLTEALQTIADKCVAYEQGNSQQRITLLQEIYNLFFAAYMLVHEDAGLPESERAQMSDVIAAANAGDNIDIKRFLPLRPKADKGGNTEFTITNSTLITLKPKNILFEDTHKAPFVVLNKNIVENLAAKLNRAFIELSQFDYYEDSRKNYIQFYDEKYADTEKVSLLQFYEDYARDKQLKDAAAKNKDGAAVNEAVLSNFEKKMESWQQTFIKVLAQQIQGRTSTENTIDIPLQCIIDTNSLESVLPKQYKSAVGAFCQIVSAEKNSEKKYQLMINGVFPGYGKMTSRFLHLFDPSITQDIRAWNESFAQDGFFAENADASFFNGNIHPLLMPYQIAVPGGHVNTVKENLIPVNDLSVTKRTDGEGLQLVDATGKPVVVFDLGFQGLFGRSALYKMLNGFSLGYVADFSIVVSAVNNEFAVTAGEDIAVCPRITIEDSIIIQRKLWVVNHSRFPKYGENDSPLKKFTQIRAWQKEIGLPTEFFVWVNRHDNKGAVEADKAIPKDAEKPQYIHLDNPILLQLLAKYFQYNAPLNISEVLPQGDDMLTVEGKKYVTEFLIQWTLDNSSNH